MVQLIKKAVLVYTFLIFCNFYINAQEQKVDTLVTPRHTKETEIDSMMTTIKVSDLAKLESELKLYRQKLKVADHERDSLKKLYVTVSSDANILSSKQRQMDAEIKSLRATVHRDDIDRVNILSNFLYIPYDSYSIDSLAIPAFENIQDMNLKEKYKIRCDLVKNYKKHTNELVKFLMDVQNEMRIPFSKKNLATKFSAQLKEQNFYQDYLQYADWGNTYIGSRIKIILSKLNNFTDDSKLNFDDIISDFKLK